MVLPIFHRTAFSVSVISFSLDIRLRWFKVCWKSDSMDYNFLSDVNFQFDLIPCENDLNMRLKIDAKLFSICDDVLTIFHPVDFFPHPIDAEHPQIFISSFFLPSHLLVFAIWSIFTFVSSILIHFHLFLPFFTCFTHLPPKPRYRNI